MDDGDKGNEDVGEHGVGLLGWGELRWSIGEDSGVGGRCLGE